MLITQNTNDNTLYIRTGSASMLALVLLFIFIGIAAFQEGDVDAGQVLKRIFFSQSL